MDPILKWPGGKRSLSKTILQYLPRTYNTYYEPFCGGAALFFALQPENAVLADLNAELIECYSTVASGIDDVLAELGRFRNTEADYYNIRATRPDTPQLRAARLIYLCRLSFNGIYRVNLRGDYNVPYGHKVHLAVVEEPQLRQAATLLSRSRLLSDDFESSVATAGPGDVIYFDPPYSVAHANNGFIKYNSRLFSWTDQERLSGIASLLVNRGCTVVVSNAFHPSIVSLYEGFEAVEIRRHSVIAAAAAARTTVSEALLIGTPR